MINRKSKSHLLFIPHRSRSIKVLIEKVMKHIILLQNITQKTQNNGMIRIRIRIETWTILKKRLQRVILTMR